MLCIYRELIKSFSKFICFNGWMMAKAEFKIKNQIEKTASKAIGSLTNIENEIIKQRKNYSVIQAGMVYGNMEYIVIMHLIKPVSTDFIKDGLKRDIRYLQMDNPGTGYMFPLEYSKSCIKEFTDCTGDNNYIHQMERPVVPGFLMFEDVLGRVFYAGNSYASTESYKIIFRKPVFADETINIYKTGSSSINRIFAMPAEGYRYVLWELERE